jgi:hypothetical protein
MSKFDASFDFLKHIRQVQYLGENLLKSTAAVLRCSNPDDLSTATNFLLNEDEIKQLNQIFGTTSAQIKNLSMIFDKVKGDARQRHLEETTIQVLQEIDPKLATRFVDELETRLGKPELDEL